MTALLDGSLYGSDESIIANTQRVWDDGHGYCDHEAGIYECRYDEDDEDVTQVVYVVAHENGDDMCGGLNLHGIYTSEDAAKDRLDEVVQEGFLGVTVFAVPTNIPGWLGYGSNLYAANEVKQWGADDDDDD